MPQQAKLMDHLYIKVDGSDLPIEVMDDLVEVMVESSLYLPSMFTIHIHDEKLKWMDQGPFGLGKPVEISAIPEEGGASRTLIKGEITALEPDFGEGTQAMLLVRGYDRSHRLHRGTNSKAYLQVTDSDLASRIANEAGLSPQVDSTTEVYDYVLQHNQTHMEFLSERAQRIGYEFFVQDKQLYFRKPPKSGETLELEWGQKLKTFRPRLTLVEQVDEVIVKGWDASTRRVIVGQASRGQAEPQTGQNQSGAQLASSAFSSARRVVVNRNVSSQAEATLQAQAILDAISGAFIEAEGVCFGVPTLSAGKFVKLTSLGQQFSGTYFVTSAMHIYSADSGYTTGFSIHGRRPGTLQALMERTPEHVDGTVWHGMAVGIVTNNQDPDGRGRVKVKFPWLSDDLESDWARVVGMGAGSGRGWFSLPEVNDEVLMAFEQGDPNRPYVIGGLWNNEDKTPLPIDKVVENNKVSQRIFKTRAGHKMTFTDGSGKGLEIETAGGHKLILADDDKKIVLQTSGGQVIQLDDSKQEISLEAKTSMSIKATNITIEASGQMALKATKVDVNNGALEVT